MKNLITLSQWNDIVEAVKKHVSENNINDECLYIFESSKNDKTRYSIYDNYDRFYMPGLDFVITEGSEKGNLSVYESSEMSYAPISFDEGLYIASNFFNDCGSEMSAELVCEYSMNNNNKQINLWNQQW